MYQKWPEKRYLKKKLLWKESSLGKGHGNAFPPRGIIEVFRRVMPAIGSKVRYRWPLVGKSRPLVSPSVRQSE